MDDIWNGSNEEIIERIASRAVKEAVGLGDAHGREIAENIKKAMESIKEAAGTGERIDLYDSLYWLLYRDTRDRLHSFDHDRFTYTSRPWTAHCKYMPSDTLSVSAGTDGDRPADGEDEDWPVLISQANPKIRAVIHDIDSLRSIAEAYNDLVNDVIIYYEELKEMYFSRYYMKSLISGLKKENPDADWEHFSPSRMIAEMKKL